MKIKVIDEYGETLKVVDTERARRRWSAAYDWDGRNKICRPTGSQWVHETLYLSRRGNYYIVRESDWQGTLPTARFVSRSEAAEWLVLNDYKLPEDLAEYDTTE